MKKAKIKQRCDEANRWMKNSRRVILARWLKPGNAHTALNCSVVAGKKAGVEIHSDKEAVIIFSHSDMKTGRYCTASMSNTCFYRHAQQWSVCHWHLIGSLSVHVNERESHQRGLQRQLQLCDTAFRQARRQRIRKPKAGSSVPAGVPVKLYIGAPYAYARLISNVPAPAAHKSCVGVHPRVRAEPQRGRGRIVCTSAVSIRWLLLQPTVKSGGRGWGEGGRNVSGMTLCEIITSPYGCRKPYIRGVYACEITAKGLIGQ